MQLQFLEYLCTYSCDIGPQCKAVRQTLFESKVVRVQRRNLAAVVARLVRIFVVHVIWYANLREDAGMNAHVLCTLFANGLELMREAVPYSTLSNLDGERWCEVFAS